ncbi:hypothetical protein [Hyalangium sp.]|uniref:hypothetical protein n=1 Tax=Hyalangium sp. TaxID=2028555 RepID=UPI002D3B971C|nr:hypothetical protein [Hyalangium sp.]HYH98710.1 hypothetical protein [Hyalangium sp.]
MRPSRPALLLLLLVTACGDEENRSPLIEGLDTSEAGIVAFLKDRRYQGWLAEPSVRASPGIHGRVRVFFNDTAVQSLRAGHDTHPRGTILVKELYADDGATLNGHALEVKVEAGRGKDTWLFYEGLLPDYQDALYGRGHPTCHGCHEAGKDYVTSALPE